MAMFDKMYTVDEVAELASVTSRTIRNYLKDGRLKGRKIGGQWRFTEQNVQDLLNGVENVPSPEIPEETQHIEPIQNIPTYQNVIKQPKTIHKPATPIAAQPVLKNEKVGKTEEEELFEDFSSDSLFQEFADEAFDDSPNAVTYLSSPKMPLNNNTSTSSLPNISSIPMGNIPKDTALPTPTQSNTPSATIEAINKENEKPPISTKTDTTQLKKVAKDITSTNTVDKKKDESSKNSKTFSSIAQENLYPDSTPTSTDSVNLTNIGKKVARFASEVHDCSKGNQICTIIDTFQTLPNAKKMIVQLADISRQESADGTLCQVYTEYDERFSIARYTLFGTTAFIERCLSILNA